MKPRRLLRASALVSVLVVVPVCVLATAESAAAPVESSPPTSAGQSLGPAARALLDKAREQARAGAGEKAAATLERALRIEPRNPWLWHRLAVLRLQQGHWNQAIHLATKSNTLAGHNGRLQGGNWEVIGLALKGLGDTAGAKRARAKARSYSSQAQD